jgi:hypothetical protein
MLPNQFSRLRGANTHGAAGRLLEAGDQVEKRALATARGTHDGQEFAGGYTEADAANGFDGDTRGGK